MAPEHRPVGTGFFPAARMGLAVGIVIAFVGAVLWIRARDAAAAIASPDDATTVVSAEMRDGAPVPPHMEPYVGLPLRGPVVAHIWLENCADCMSAFEAYRVMREADGLHGLPQVNVAYGSSTPEFAARYRVNENLVVDADGMRAVKPFGIGSFTTLVLDEHGTVIHRDRPDTPGYVERVKAAWTRALR